MHATQMNTAVDLKLKIGSPVRGHGGRSQLQALCKFVFFSVFTSLLRVTGSHIYGRALCLTIGRYILLPR